MKNLFETIDVASFKRFSLQALFIIGAVLLSIVSVTWILEKGLVKRALEQEADAFIESYRSDPGFPLPRTRNLNGYLTEQSNLSSIPKEIAGFEPGLYPEVKFADRDKMIPVYVRDFDSKRLFLVFEGAQIDRLVGIFGLVPLSVLLIVLYTSSWVAYQISWRAVSPILSIAKRLQDYDPDKEPFQLPKQRLTGEAKELGEALEKYNKRIDAFLERERQFTADVSHELRTPMTIIDGAAQFLANEDEISEKGYHRVQLIRRACRDVNEMITAFLMLAREEQLEKGQSNNVADIIEAEIIKLHSSSGDKPIRLSVDIQNDFYTDTPAKVLEIIIGNLCRNAYKYTEEGEISVSLIGQTIYVKDTGTGIPEELLPVIFKRHTRGRGNQQAGEGIGLAIVKRLCDQFGWHIQIANQSSGGVVVTLTPKNITPASKPPAH